MSMQFHPPIEFNNYNESFPGINRIGVPASGQLTCLFELVWLISSIASLVLLIRFRNLDFMMSKDENAVSHTSFNAI